MSRDLEREYRVLVNSEVPDLWAGSRRGWKIRRRLLKQPELICT